jgi:hypothetical protein
MLYQSDRVYTISRTTIIFNSKLSKKEQKPKIEDGLHGTHFQNLYFFTSKNTKKYTSSHSCISCMYKVTKSYVLTRDLHKIDKYVDKK